MYLVSYPMRGDSLVESIFSKVIGEISTLYNSITCTGVWNGSCFGNFKKSTVCNNNPEQFS